MNKKARVIGGIIGVVVWMFVELIAVIINDGQNYGFMILNLPASIYYSYLPATFNNFYVALVSLLLYVIAGFLIGGLIEKLKSKKNVKSGKK